jgi:hypothetical protein
MLIFDHTFEQACALWMMTQTQNAKREFKTAIEWYSVVALRTGPDLEDEDLGLESETSRQKLPADLVPAWQRGHESVEAAPP